MTAFFYTRLNLLYGTVHNLVIARIKMLITSMFWSGVRAYSVLRNQPCLCPKCNFSNHGVEREMSCNEAWLWEHTSGQLQPPGSSLFWVCWTEWSSYITEELYRERCVPNSSLAWAGTGSMSWLVAQTHIRQRFQQTLRDVKITMILNRGHSPQPDSKF